MSSASFHLKIEDPPVSLRPNRTVETCYSAFDRFFPACGLFDLPEGVYHGKTRLSYKQAQVNQNDYLLDQVQCRTGVRLLDIGCG